MDQYGQKTGLKDKVITLKKDLQVHIIQRIYLLTHLSEIDVNASRLFDSNGAPKLGRDPWLMSTQLEGTDEKTLIATSLHVREILFASHEVSKTIREKSSKFLKELKKFKEVLPSYISQLSHLTNDEAKNIQDAFDRLYKLIKNNKLDKVDSQISNIRKILRHSGNQSQSAEQA